MHSCTRTATQITSMAFLRSALCRSGILGSSSKIGGGSRGPLVGQKQCASDPEASSSTSKRRRISTD